MSEGKSKSDQKNRKNLLRATTYIIIILAIMGVIWLLPRVALGTSTPFFAVSSGSMVPILNVGDYIVVNKVPFNELQVGDIIVFHSNEYTTFMFQSTDIVVHRIYSITTDYSGERVIRTWGDANHGYVDPWLVYGEDYIGKYTGFKIPYLGYLAFLFPYPINYIFIISIIIIMFIIELLPTEKKENKLESSLFKY